MCCVCRQSVSRRWEWMKLLKLLKKWNDHPVNQNKLNCWICFEPRRTDCWICFLGEGGKPIVHFLLWNDNATLCETNSWFTIPTWPNQWLLLQLAENNFWPPWWCQSADSGHQQTKTFPCACFWFWRVFSHQRNFSLRAHTNLGAVGLVHNTRSGFLCLLDLDTVLRTCISYPSCQTSYLQSSSIPQKQPAKRFYVSLVVLFAPEIRFCFAPSEHRTQRGQWPRISWSRTGDPAWAAHPSN